MSSLTIFPIEILEWITSVVTTSEQLRLWQCGDRILNIKLKNGGLKRTSLCWSSSAWMPWPRWYFATFDGLVDVEWAVDIGISLCPTLELNLLPTTLKRLHLACDDVFLLLWNQYIDLNDALPLLRSLYLEGSLVCEENLQNLPSNLTELHVVSRDACVESSTIFHDLPRSIKTLELSFTIVDQSELENDLPSQLISLDIESLECNFDWFSKLPQSLKSFKILYYSWTPSWLKLPPQLEELMIAGGTSDDFGQIPLSVLPHLPSTLKTLEAKCIIEDIEGEMVPLLPKNLTRFSLKHHYFYNPRELQQIPLSLTDFDVSVSVNHPDIISLYHTEAIRMLIGSPLSESSILAFPTKLQYLSTSYINDDICVRLPMGLRSLTVYGGLITTKGASQLPKSLTSLTAHFQVFENNETFAFLVKIPKLALVTGPTLPVGAVNEKWISYLLRPSFLPANTTIDYSSDMATPEGENHQLTFLSVYGGVAKALIGKPFFDSLPRFKNLNTLYIANCTAISADSLSFIPPTVTDLMIPLDAFPTATQLSTLPKRLIYLDIAVGGMGVQRCNWEDEDLQSLPRSLQKLIINGMFQNLTPHMFDYLPPNLQKTSLCSVLDFLSPCDRLHGEEIYQEET